MLVLWGHPPELFLEEDARTDLLYRGWVREDALVRLLPGGRPALERLYAASRKRSFEPVDLGFDLEISGTSAARAIQASNVAARLPGETDRDIVLSAHIDHLGQRDPAPGEDPSADRIYNGALDNASALTAMVFTARALARSPVPQRYGITLLACHAEEAGLLGNRFFVRTAGASRFVADINFESTPVWERAGTLLGVGARFSSLEGDLARVAERLGVGTAEFSLVNQGFFYRSDQFSFARAGVPSLWISAGEDDASGQRRYEQFWKTTYHTVNDAYDPSWPLEGLAQTVEAVTLLVEEIQGRSEPPVLRGDLPFPVDALTP